MDDFIILTGKSHAMVAATSYWNLNNVIFAWFSRNLTLAPGVVNKQWALIKEHPPSKFHPTMRRKLANFINFVLNWIKIIFNAKRTPALHAQPSLCMVHAGQLCAAITIIIIIMHTHTHTHTHTWSTDGRKIRVIEQHLSKNFSVYRELNEFWIIILQENTDGNDLETKLSSWCHTYTSKYAC